MKDNVQLTNQDTVFSFLKILGLLTFKNSVASKKLEFILFYFIKKYKTCILVNLCYLIKLYIYYLGMACYYSL